MAIKYAKRGQFTENKYWWFDGSIVPIDTLKDDDKELFCCKGNYVDTENTFSSKRGFTVASQFIGTFVSINVFNDVDISDISNINELDQWLTGSKDLDSEEYIGYQYTDGELFTLNKVSFIPRVGPQGRVGLKSPTPKVVQIQGAVKDAETDDITWMDITEDTLLNPQEFLEVTEFDFEDEIDIALCGFRLVIKSWWPGAEEGMMTGLYKVKFTTTPKDVVRLKEIEPTKKGYSACIDRLDKETKVEEVEEVNTQEKIIEELEQEYKEESKKIENQVSIDDTVISSPQYSSSTIDKLNKLEEKVEDYKLITDEQFDNVHKSITDLEQKYKISKYELITDSSPETLSLDEFYYYVNINVITKEPKVINLINVKPGITIYVNVDNAKDKVILISSYLNFLYKHNEYDRLVLESDSVPVILRTDEYSIHVTIIED